MNRINITIPDDLTPEQEFMAIAKALGKKMLPATGNKQLGEGYEIKDMDTTIVITRKSIIKPIVTHTCPMCPMVFTAPAAYQMWTNYGGKKKLHYYCSAKCRQTVFDVCGPGRASFTSKKLTPLRPLHV